MSLHETGSGAARQWVGSEGCLPLPATNVVEPVLAEWLQQEVTEEVRRFATALSTDTDDQHGNGKPRTRELTDVPTAPS